MKLNPYATTVIKFLGEEYSEDFGCFTFKGIMTGTGIKDRAIVRRACRLLARKGLARYERALWSDDGDMIGAGYGATIAGRDYALSISTPDVKAQCESHPTTFAAISQTESER